MSTSPLTGVAVGLDVGVSVGGTAVEVGSGDDVGSKVGNAVSVFKGDGVAEDSGVWDGVTVRWVMGLPLV